MKTLLTDRLVIRRLCEADADFMLALLSEPSWHRFIGDRGVRTVEQAKAYILQGPMAMYASHGYGFCLVESRHASIPLGICGLAKREYLDSPDIGFAFLPQHWHQGYAYESAAAVLDYARTELGLSTILATTRTDNTSSINLLEKLGLRFKKHIPHPTAEDELSLYSTED